QLWQPSILSRNYSLAFGTLSHAFGIGRPWRGLVFDFTATRGLAPTALFGWPLRGLTADRRRRPAGLPFLDFLGKGGPVLATFPWTKFPRKFRRRNQLQRRQ